jgi:Family of unknown function (DUF6527)
MSKTSYYASVADIPKVLSRHEIALVRAGDRLKWAVFECPCGYGHRIMINLDPRRRPVWRIAHVSPLSVVPSIDSREKRRCHFWLTSNHVRWVKEAEVDQA